MIDKNVFPFEDNDDFSRPVSEEELNVLLKESGVITVENKDLGLIRNSYVLGKMGEGRRTYLRKLS